MSSKVRFLMCRPDLYDADYVINPWMEGNVHKPSRTTAVEQWQGLARLLEESAEVETIAPQPGLPDMVFTANAGISVGQKFVLSRFLTRAALSTGGRVKSKFLSLEESNIP